MFAFLAALTAADPIVQTVDVTSKGKTLLFPTDHQANEYRYIILLNPKDFMRVNINEQEELQTVYRYEKNDGGKLDLTIVPKNASKTTILEYAMINLPQVGYVSFVINTWPTPLLRNPGYEDRSTDCYYVFLSPVEIGVKFYVPNPSEKLTTWIQKVDGTKDQEKQLTDTGLPVKILKDYFKIVHLKTSGDTTPNWGVQWMVTLEKLDPTKTYEFGAFKYGDISFQLLGSHRADMKGDFKYDLNPTSLAQGNNNIFLGTYQRRFEVEANKFVVFNVPKREWNHKLVIHAYKSSDNSEITTKNDTDGLWFHEKGYFTVEDPDCRKVFVSISVIDTSNYPASAHREIYFGTEKITISYSGSGEYSDKSLTFHDSSSLVLICPNTLKQIHRSSEMEGNFEYKQFDMNGNKADVTDGPLSYIFEFKGDVKSKFYQDHTIGDVYDATHSPNYVEIGVDSSAQTSGGLSPGAKAGIAVAVIIIIAAIAGGVGFFVWKKMKSGKESA